MNSPKFSKRHYEAIAEVLNECNENCNEEVHSPGILLVANELKRMFCEDNSNFSELKFDKAIMKLKI